MRYLRAVVLLVLGAIAPLADAQSFPERPVTLIVPWPAGGSTDVVMRAFAEATSKYLGQRVNIDNRPDASGTIGPAWMASSSAWD